ncbi:MAG: ABC transporter ATP-binding protein/permease [Actinobacteria bacterium]|nr:ABC transporter ATP-binding protein/permease [Actinomycetota bacterium]
MSPAAVVRTGLQVVTAHVRRRPVPFAIAVLGSLLFSAAIVASSVVLGWVTDELIVPVLDGNGTGRIRLAVALIVGVGVAKAVGIILRRAAAAALQYGTKNDLRERIVDHQLGLTMRWYASHPTGDLLSVAEADTTQATYVLAPLPYGVGAAALLLGAAAIIAVTDPWMGVIAVLWVATSLAINIRGSWRMAGLGQAVQRLRGEVASTAHESFDGALTVKALGRERDETRRLRRDAERLRDQLVELGVIRATYNVAHELLPGVVTVIVVVLGAWRITADVITAGELVRVTFLLSLVLWPSRLIGFTLWQLGDSVPAWHRVQSVLTADDEVAYGERQATEVDRPAPVEGDGVRFAYPDGPPVLDAVQLDIPAGRTVAVVGPTGSGKTTLTLLLARLWDPVSGAIRLDARDVRDFASGELARELAYVTQEAFLFDDTVRGNIALRDDLDPKDVERAARMARAHEFVSALPGGYDTRVGERGVALSGGQRQRLALARALAQQPRLLLLDDATSAVDPSVEAEILRNLKDADLPATVLIVAYRPSSIALADEVVFVEDGRIVAHDRHETLLRLPAYSRLLRAYEQDAQRRDQHRSAGRVPGGAAT